MSDSDELQAVYEDGFKKSYIYKEEKPISNYMKKRIANPEMPPKGSKKLQRLQAIRLKKDDSIIGYLDIYHGWPRKDVVWIGDLFLLSSMHGKKFGQEIVDGLAMELKKLTIYKHMRCIVSLLQLFGNIYLGLGYKLVLKQVRCVFCI